MFRPEHGTIVFPRLRQAMSKSSSRLLREKYETSVVPGSFFDMPQHFRIGIGGDPEMTRVGLERLARRWMSTRRQGVIAGFSCGNDCLYNERCEVGRAV